MFLITALQFLFCHARTCSEHLRTSVNEWEKILGTSPRMTVCVAEDDSEEGAEDNKSGVLATTKTTTERDKFLYVQPV